MFRHVGIVVKDIEKQLKEIQKIDFNAMSPEELQKMVDQLFDYTEEAETQLNNEINKDEPKDS